MDSNNDNNEANELMDNSQILRGIRNTHRLTNWLYRFDSNRVEHICHISHIRKKLDFLFLFSNLIMLNLQALFFLLKLKAHESRHYLLTLFYLESSIFAWIICFIKIYMYTFLDYVTFNRVKHNFKPEVKRRIDDLTEREALNWTGFQKRQLKKLLLHFRLP